MNVGRWLATTAVLGALLIVVLLVGGWVRAYADRTRDRNLRVQGCIRSLTDRAEGIQRDGDLEAFLREAAAARRMDHRFAVARRYELIAHRAHRRQISASRRMLGADPRVSLIAVTAGPACRAEYPAPSLLPF
jgi:hypothetical protein